MKWGSNHLLGVTLSQSLLAIQATHHSVFAVIQDNNSAGESAMSFDGRGDNPLVSDRQHAWIGSESRTFT
jgi:hypothetical protein